MLLRLPLVLLLCMALPQCATLPRPLLTECRQELVRNHEVSVVGHGWHTGFVVPRTLLTDRIPILRQRFPTGDHLEVGWGDKGFYQAQQITTGISVRAVCWPSDTVVHVVSVPGPIEQTFPHSQIRRIPLHASEIAALVEFMARSFAVSHSGEVISGQAGLYGNSQFYQGVGHYHLFNTCNKWTAKGLRSAGLPIRPMFKLSASSVIDWIDDEPRPEAEASLDPAASLAFGQPVAVQPSGSRE